MIRPRAGSDTTRAPCGASVASTRRRCAPVAAARRFDRDEGPRGDGAGGDKPHLLQRGALGDLISRRSLRGLLGALGRLAGGLELQVVPSRSAAWALRLLRRRSVITRNLPWDGCADSSLLAAALVVLAAAVAGVLGAATTRRRPGAASFPTPPGKAGERREPLTDPFAWDPRARRGARAPRRRRQQPPAVHALAGRRGGERRAHGALARRQVERAAEQAGVDADTLEALVFLESAGREDARAPGGLEGAVGLTQILAETGQNLLGMRVDLAAQPRATRGGSTRAERRGRDAAPRALRAGASARRRALRPREGARRHRPLPDARARARSAARTWRSSPTTWASATSRACCATTAAARPPLRAALLRLHAAAPRATPTGGWRPRRRLVELPGGSSPPRGRSCGLPGGPRRAATGWPRCTTPRDPPRRCCTRRTDTARFDTAADAAARVGRRRHRAVPEARGASTGLRRDRRMGELAPRLDQPVALPRAAAGGARDWRCTSAPRCARSSGGRHPDRDLDGARRRYQDLLVSRNREATRHYSLHTTGWAFDIAARATARAAQALGVPVRARPAADAEPDRLGARAGRDPHHRRRATRKRCSPLLERVNIDPP